VLDTLLQDPNGYPCIEYNPWKLEYVPDTDERCITCKQLYDRIFKESDRFFEIIKKRLNKVTKPRKVRDGQKT